MKFADAGWVWEGQGLDHGVHPSIFGAGEGAEFFGLRRAFFMFHPNTELALQKLSGLEEVVCDISKWGFKDSPKGGSDPVVDMRLETVCTEAERVSRLSRIHPNVTGALFDDMKALLEREGMDSEVSAALGFSLRMYNAALRLWAVAYSHDLESPFWEHCVAHIGGVNLWVWNPAELVHLEQHVGRARDRFPGRPLILGCYLRDYASRAPMPMEALQKQWEFVAKALGDGRLDGYAILGTVLIDGHLRQATWVRDFIRDHS
jgi:hypothetical protein